MGWKFPQQTVPPPIPNPYYLCLRGQSSGGCRAPGLIHVGATRRYGPDFLVVPPACSKGDVAAAATQCCTLNHPSQHATSIPLAGVNRRELD